MSSPLSFSAVMFSTTLDKQSFFTLDVRWSAVWAEWSWRSSLIMLQHRQQESLLGRDQTHHTVCCWGQIPNQHLFLHASEPTSCYYTVIKWFAAVWWVFCPQSPSLWRNHQQSMSPLNLCCIQFWFFLKAEHMESFTWCQHESFEEQNLLSEMTSCVSVCLFIYLFIVVVYNWV